VSARRSEPDAPLPASDLSCRESERAEAGLLIQRIESGTYVLRLLREEPIETLIDKLIDYCLDVEELCRSYRRVSQSCLHAHFGHATELRAKLKRRTDVEA
jgi:hypothetical protein